MEPLTPNDPLWNVLGKAKLVKPRANFVQNVMRAARQTPQERGWLAQFKGWWQERESPSAGLTWAALATVVMLAVSLTLMTRNEAPQTAAVPVIEETLLIEADFPLVSEFETEWKKLETMGDLLAVQDTSELTDREIHLLLY
ncbi:MAG: hypothetical protein ABL974_23495 [Prosthecobacter sp.]